MSIETDDSFLDDQDGMDADTEMWDEIFSGELDARRRIERYRELTELRHCLDDPEFELDFN